MDIRELMLELKAIIDDNPGVPMEVVIDSQILPCVMPVKSVQAMCLEDSSIRPKKTFYVTLKMEKMKS